MEGYRLVRVKRDWVPEWLWYIAAQPIPFWNYVFYQWPISIGPLVRFLSTDDPDALHAANEEGGG